MPNARPGTCTNSGWWAGAVRVLMDLIFPDCPATTFAHPERKYGPVRAGGDNRGRMSGVTAAHNSTTRIALVARRHVDFKRVCSCCCLP
ncbi:Ms4527A family Cys-rich leader peptide [Mycolicibacterium neworleansense]|uniref:Ms4527A family Cys-rich leader peptide n=1 Tax=Mycolicibacterium neworleansense TaxID=146018 RepID=UPI0038991B84